MCRHNILRIPAQFKRAYSYTRAKAAETSAQDVFDTSGDIGSDFRIRRLFVGDESGQKRNGDPPEKPREHTVAGQHLKSAVERDGKLLVLFTAHMECAGFAEVSLETGLPAFVRGRLDHPMHLKHLKRFAQFSPHMQKAFDFMLRKDLRTLPVGRYEIDGDNCWAMIQQVDLKKLEPEMKIEAHRRYIDIQMPLEGCELYGTAWIRGDEPALGFDVAKDVGFMEVPVRETELRAGETAYAIFLPPHGAHAPGCSKDGTGSIRKLVIKVRRD